MSDLVRIGIPTALEQMALRFGVIMFLKIVSGLGNNVYAAHQIALNVLSLSYSVFIDQFIRDMIILLRFRSGRWKNIRIA